MFSVDLVFKHLGGGPGDLQLLMLKENDELAPPIWTIKKWKARGRIPPKWIGGVIWSLARAGVDPLLLLEDIENGD